MKGCTFIDLDLGNGNTILKHKFLKITLKTFETPTVHTVHVCSIV